MKSPATISPVQLFCIILQTQIGIGLLSLPYTVQEKAGKEAWLSILFAGLLIQGIIALMWLLSSRFPGLTIYEFAPLIVGKLIGTVIKILYVLFFFVIIAQELAHFLSISSNWAFPRTPYVVFAVLMLAVSVYLAKENIRIIARFHVLASLLLLVILPVLIPLIPHFDIQYLLMFGSNGMKDIGMGMEKTINSFMGFELLLFLFPFTEGSSSAKWKAAAGAHALSTFIYASLAFSAAAIFSPEELKTVPEPVLYILKEIELIIIERIDLLFLTMWAILVITTLISYLYIASTGLTHLFKLKEHKKPLYVLAVLVIPLAIASEDRLEIIRIGDQITNAYLILFVVIPIILLLIAWIRKKKEAASV